MFVYSKKITDPIHAISKASKKLSGGDFSARVKVYKDDEIGELATCERDYTVTRGKDFTRYFVDKKLNFWPFYAPVCNIFCKFAERKDGE